MAQNIGDLYFSLGLDDRNLKSQWDAALAKYKSQRIDIPVAFKVDPKSLQNLQRQLNQMQFPNFKASFDEVRRVLVDITNVANRAAGAMQNVKNNVAGAAQSASTFSGKMEEAGLNALRANEYLKGHRGILGDIVSYARRYVSVWGMVSIGRSIVRITGEIEYQRRALESVMQNAEKANEIWGQIQGLAVKSPFQVGDLLKYTKQLSAFGIENEHLFDTMKRLADVSSGLGVDLSRIALAYGEINAATVLRGKETRQLTQAGIPIIRELAKTFGELEGRIVSTGEVYKRIFSREVSFDMVAKVFKDLTSEGGKFYQMQEKQAATLKGSIKNIADQWTLMANEIGNSNATWIKSFVEGIKSAMNNWQSWMGVLKTGLVTFAGFKIVSNLTFSFIAFTRTVSSLAKAIYEGATAGSLFRANMLKCVNAITLVATGLAVGISAVVRWAKELHGAAKIEAEYAAAKERKVAAEGEELAKLEMLKTSLKLAEGEQKKYNEAKEAIIRAYPDYFNKLRAEGKEIGDLTTHYKNLETEALNAARARGLADSKEALGKTFGEETKKLLSYDILKKLRGYKGKELSASDLKYVSAYITGTLPAAATKDFLNAIGLSEKNGFGSIDEAMKYLESKGNWLNRKTKYSKFGSSWVGKLLRGPEYMLSLADIADLRRIYSDQYSTFQQTLTDITEIYGDIPEPPDGVVEKLFDWQKNIQDILKQKGFDNRSRLWVSEDTTLLAYGEGLAKMRKEIVAELDTVKSISKQSVSDAKEYAENRKKLENELAAIDQIAKKYNIDVLGKSGQAAAQRAENQAVKEAIRRGDEQLQWVEALREYYKKFKELGMPAKEAQDELLRIFGGNINLPKGLTFSEALEADEKTLLTTFKGLYDAIGTEAVKSSENMQQRLTKAEAKIIEERLKFAQKLEEKLKEWGAKDFEVEGEGGLFKLSKIIADLNSKNNALAIEKEQLLTKMKIHLSEEEFAAKKKLVEDYYRQQEEYNKKNAAQQVAALGDTFVKQATKELDVAFRNAGQKSFSYLRQALKEFGVIAKQDFGVISSEDKAKIIKMDSANALGAYGRDYDTFFSQFSSKEDFENALNASDISESGREQLRVLYNASTTLGGVNGLLSAIAAKLGARYQAAEEQEDSAESKYVGQYFSWANKIGGVIGGTGGNIIGTLASAGSSYYQGVKQIGKLKAAKDTTGAWVAAITMFIEGVTTMYSTINNTIKRNKETVRQWRAAIQEATHAARLNAIEQLAYKQSNVWGVESPYKKIQAAARQYWEGVEQLAKSAEDLTEKGKLQKGIKKVVDGNTVAGTAAGGALAGAGVGIGAALASGATIGAAFGSWAGPIGAAIGVAIGSIVGLLVRKKTPTYKKLTDVYGQIYDPETLELNQDIVNDYAKMNDETKKLIDNWEEIKAKIQEAKEEMESQISDLTGDLGSDIKDMLVSAFSDGDIFAAIDDIDAYLGDVIKNLALQSAYAAMFEGVFNELQQRMMDSFASDGDQDIADDLLWLRDILPNYVEGFGQVLEVLQDALAENGIDTNLGDGGTTSSSAISSVTEETASRLLGQINAIRADVSVKRALIEAYLPMVGTINETMANGLVSLREIELNTRRGADMAEEIRDFFASVRGVSTTNAGYAINVNIA